VSIIAVVLCFFVLWLSFTANVNENAWEFGVLRAVGLNVTRVMRMYIYEALCLIAASVFIGTTIGIFCTYYIFNYVFSGMLVSVTLTLQFNLFTELAFTFDFPYALFFSVFAMSILVAVIGSYLPTNSMKKKDIAIALKNM
jgi:ABC-type antimicrobial peptide transport system permease subunit